MNSIIRNTLAVIGLTGILYGLHAAWPPAAWIVGGAACFGVAVVWHLRGDGNERGQP